VPAAKNTVKWTWHSAIRKATAPRAMVVAAFACIVLGALTLLGREVPHPGRPACSIPAPCEISFRKHTLDLGASETSAVADVNRDGRFAVVSGEYWYDQLPPSARGSGQR